MKNLLAISLSLAFAGVFAAQSVPSKNSVNRPASRMDCGDLERIDEYVASYRDMAAFDGVVLIAVDDSVVYHCAYGLADYRFGVPIETDTRFRIASLSKQFTAAAIGLLASDHSFSLDAPISEFLSEFAQGNRITVRHLLDHTSGIAHTNRLDWMDMQHPMSLSEIMDRLSDEPLSFEPGSDRAYSNGGYAVLAAITEVVSGQSFADFITKTFAERGYPSVGHEEAYSVVEKMAHRYAPGPVYGRRVEAPVYVTANRIGGGSLFATAEDVWRFFRDSYRGAVVGETLTTDLFPLPDDSDVLITGRSPGALAQVFIDFNSGLSVVTLSSNSAWPASFNSDIVELYRGNEAHLEPFTLSEPSDGEHAEPYTGSFVAQRFGWEVDIESTKNGLVFRQGDDRTAFARTRKGAFHLPIYDWLCDYEADGNRFTCRQRDPDATIRFVFDRVE